jgi:flagellar biosynthesis/type III secretory pathway M-ring protein FliF/YscJ
MSFKNISNKKKIMIVVLIIIAIVVFLLLLPKVKETTDDNLDSIETPQSDQEIIDEIDGMINEEEISQDLLVDEEDDLVDVEDFFE